MSSQVGKLFQICFCFLTISGGFVNSSSAASVVELKSGHRFESEQILKEDAVIVFVEKDCTACKEQIALFDNCPGLNQRLKYFSFSTAAQTKKFWQIMKSQQEIYLANRRDFLDVRGTPTTWTSKGKSLGVLSCEAKIL